ncbi:hypothetical protein DRO61_07685 [Candidatus Bathyarchaeota archaeon]|nr:MAG: hypothetical protein DRO61_07685 [Candidatus Bathyarchaeota archaeon]
MAKVNQKEVEQRKLNELKKNSIVLESIGDIVINSEAILKSINKIHNSGSKMYARKFKQFTKNYRVSCVEILNRNYDLMETGGVTDVFLTEMREKSMIVAQITELDRDKVRKLGKFLADMLEPEEEVEEEVKEAVEPVIEEIEEVIESIDEVEDDPVEVVTGNLLDKELEKASPDYKPLDETSIVVSKAEFNDVKESYAKEGVPESDLVKKTLDSVSIRKGIDTDMYNFKNVVDKEDYLVLNFILKV